MAMLPTTHVATSEPVNIGKASFDFFPLNSTPTNPQLATPNSVGVTLTPGVSFWDTTFSALVFKVGTDCGCTVVAGFLHGFSLGMDVSGTFNQDGSLALQVDNDEAQGGTFMGVSAGASIGVNLSRLSVQWVSDGWDSGFESTWVNLLNFDASFTADVINLIAVFAVALGAPNTGFLKAVNTLNHSADLSGIYGIYDDRSDQMSETGVITLLPSFNINVNAVLETPAASAAEGMNELGGHLEFGPFFGFSMPVNITINRVQTDNGNVYYNPNPSNPQLTDGKLILVQEGVVLPPPQSVETLHITFQHTVGFTLNFGLFAGIGLAGALSLGGSFTLDDQTIGEVGPFYDRLDSDTPQAALGYVHKAFEDSLAEVIFEPIA
jgi:hypothetical protein